MYVLYSDTLKCLYYKRQHDNFNVDTVDPFLVEHQQNEED